MTTRPARAIARSQRWRPLLAALTLALALPLATEARAAEAPPTDTTAPAAEPQAVPAQPPSDQRRDAIRYRVALDVPRALTELVTASVDLVRWQDYEDMTEDLLDRLMREAVAQAREAVAVEGYFDPAVDVSVDRRASPLVVTLKVVPGERVRIAAVDIVVQGPATSDGAEAAASIEKLRREWLLPQGAPFRQADWTRAKERAVATLAATFYASARVTASEALVDPEERSARLSITLESGPPFRFGELAIRGLSRYDASLVRNFSTIEPGEPYRLTRLDEFVRRLTGSGYFSSVQAAIVSDPAKADAAPVDVAVVEGRTKTLEFGVGYSTDTLFRSNVNYTDVNLDGRALQFNAQARLEQKEQSASVRFTRPPNDAHWRDSLVTQLRRTDIAGLVTQTASAVVERASVEERVQDHYNAGFYLDEQRPSGADVVRSHALYLELGRTWRRVDDLVAPTQGTILDARVGAGVPGVSTRTFGRAIARFGFWWPLGLSNQFAARLEGGAVFAGSRQGVPSTFLFRTGGDTTVRGYALESLGVREGDAIVPGRYYAVASAEVTHWIRENIGIAGFVDAGNAVDHPRDLSHLAVGYGVGARIRSPVGPFRFDIAYGQDVHKVRLHFSAGITF